MRCGTMRRARSPRRPFSSPSTWTRRNAAPSPFPTTSGRRPARCPTPRRLRSRRSGSSLAAPRAMRILVANDDGIYSPGICALAEVAAEFGDVRVVAPDVEQSSMGHAITASRPLSYRATKLSGIEAYRVNGTPADCVALGCHNWDKVDVVLSGVNLGLNLGNSIWHSGTLAA